MHHLLDLSDDVLVYIFSFLHIPEILCLRKTCRRMNVLSRFPIVWIEACKSQVLAKGFPFPRCSLQDLQQEELEKFTRRAFHLAQRWLQTGGALCPRKETKFVVSPSAPISDIRFIEGFEERFLLTVSKGIWSVLTIWDISFALGGITKEKVLDTSPRKCCEWSPKGGLFTGLALNSDLQSDAKLAVSIAMDSGHQVQLMNISIDGQLIPICSIDIAMKPMTLEGDLLALSDDHAQTTIYNWKTGDYAVLKHLQDQEGVWKQQDHCIQVIFAYSSVLVVRARSIHLFPEPVLKPAKDDATVYLPIARHSFGWIDGVSVVPPSSIRSEVRVMSDVLSDCALLNDTQPASDIFTAIGGSNTLSEGLPPPLTILVRSQSDNPWTSDEHSLDLYALMPNPDTSCDVTQSDPLFLDNLASPVAADTPVPTLSDTLPEPRRAPYLFPPLLTSRISSIRGSLRCTDVVLGPCRTAIWIRPHDRSLAGLMGGLQNGEQYQLPSYLFEQTERSQEGLVCAVFPGPLCQSHMRKSGAHESSRGTENTSRHSKAEGDVRMMWMNELNNWTTLDYYEAMGRIALGSGDGYVTLLEL